MAHTYTNLIFHIVFSTKDRLSLINNDQKAELQAYIASLVAEKGGKVLIINNMPDHVHILIVLPPDVSVSDLMKFVKANSSRWMKQRFGKPFAWQKGFGRLPYRGPVSTPLRSTFAIRRSIIEKWTIVTNSFRF